MIQFLRQHLSIYISIGFFQGRVSFFDLTDIIQRIIASSLYQNTVSIVISSQSFYDCLPRSLRFSSRAILVTVQLDSTFSTLFYRAGRNAHLSFVEIVKSTSRTGKVTEKKSTLRKIVESRPLFFGARQSKSISLR